MQLKLRSVLKGIGTRVPLFGKLANARAGGDVPARYWYAVWMRHLCMVTRMLGRIRFDSVAELGPGDSLGIGFCALLSGATRYFGLDRKAFATSGANEELLEDLIKLFLQRARIPDDGEFPNVIPRLDNYDFPSDVLDDTWLHHCLAPSRLDAIRRAAKRDKPRGTVNVEIRYFAPWDQKAEIQPDSVDWALSQAVLEHVDDPDQAYRALMQWLRKGGVMSHAIDYSSHGITRDWNGHWTVSDLMWRIVRGRRAYLINRLPHSEHLRLLHECGYDVAIDVRSVGVALPRASLDRRYQTLTDSDLSTHGAFLIATRPSAMESRAV